MILNTKMLQAIADLVDSDGNLYLQDNMKIADDQWIGLGTAAGRIVFDDQATDVITFSNADVLIGSRITFGGGTNDDGIVFGSLSTATKGIDFSSSELSGSGDYWIYNSTTNFWTAAGVLTVPTIQGATTLAIREGGMVNKITLNNFDTSLGLGVVIEGYNNATYPNNVIIQTGQYSSILLGNKTAVGSWAGDGVSSAGTANITDVGGAVHGLSLAVGDLVHIQNCTTASHKGFYRIVTAGATTLVLDRVLAATDTDLTVTFYKDVIGFFAADGTNGQRITGYSHQDKPLQIGGDVLKATTNLGSEDVLFGNLTGIYNAAAAPGGALTDGIIMYAADSADATSSLSLYLEQAVEAIGTFTASNKIKVQINGTWYWIQLDAV